jgi:RNA polymerase sigma-70 factor (ECF subfamily)
MDEDLVVKAQGGDQRAFAELIVASHPRLFRLANGILGNPYLAEDATQQAYLSMWQDIRRLRDPGRFEGWAYRIVVHACYRESKRMPTWLPEEAVPAGQEPRDIGSLDVVLDRDQLERGFRQLPVEQRAVLVLHYLLDMTLVQVATVLDIPLGTANSRLSRAVAGMRAALEADARPALPARVPQEAVR